MTLLQLRLVAPPFSLATRPMHRPGVAGRRSTQPGAAGRRANAPGVRGKR